VAEDQWELGLGELAADDVQVGAADATGMNLQPQLAFTGLTVRKLRLLQRSPDAVDHHRGHRDPGLRPRVVPRRTRLPRCPETIRADRRSVA
jgi:hypothetical protein